MCQNVHDFPVNIVPVHTSFSLGGLWQSWEHSLHTINYGRCNWTGAPAAVFWNLLPHLYLVHASHGCFQPMTELGRDTKADPCLGDLGLLWWILWLKHSLKTLSNLLLRTWWSRTLLSNIGASDWHHGLMACPAFPISFFYFFSYRYFPNNSL